MNIYMSLSLFSLIILSYWIITEWFTILFRFTGLPDERARFQVISLLTGCGYTTKESEMFLSLKLSQVEHYYLGVLIPPAAVTIVFVFMRVPSIRTWGHGDHADYAARGAVHGRGHGRSHPRGLRRGHHGGGAGKERGRPRHDPRSRLALAAYPPDRRGHLRRGDDPAEPHGGNARRHWRDDRGRRPGAGGTGKAAGRHHPHRG